MDMADRLVGEQIRLNYRDYCALPDDGRRYEILDGELVVSPSPKTVHQVVVGNLFVALTQHVRETQKGDVFVAPLDVLLAEESIVQPDLIYVSKAKRYTVGEGQIKGVPDLLVEVVSPARPELDFRDKRQLYAKLGVPWYWIVDPQARLVLELKLAAAGYAELSRPSGDDVFEPQLFPGLRIKLAEVWE